MNRVNALLSSEINVSSTRISAHNQFQRTTSKQDIRSDKINGIEYLGYWMNSILATQKSQLIMAFAFPNV